MLLTFIHVHGYHGWVPLYYSAMGLSMILFLCVCVSEVFIWMKKKKKKKKKKKMMMMKKMDI